MVEKLAIKITNWLNSYCNKTGIELLKMERGVQVLKINLSKLLVIMAVSVKSGVFKETMLVSIAILGLKRYTFGLHAKNSWVCTVISIFIQVIAPLLIKDVTLSNGKIFIFFTGFIFLLCKYAPSDTENHPLLDVALRTRLKRNAVLTCGIYMFIALTIPYQVIKNCVLLSVLVVVIGILPITYKILGRRIKNYEYYEEMV